MSPSESTAALVLYADLLGRIAEIAQDDLSTRMHLALGRPFALTVDPVSFSSALSFTSALHTRGVVFGWNLETPTADGREQLLFAGTRAGDQFLIIAARTADALRSLIAYRSRLNGDASAPWRSIYACTDGATPCIESDEAILNEFMRLNNEMAALQRELARQNARLQAANRVMRDHADELELRIEERSVELSATRSKFSTMLETAGMGIALVDRDGKVAQANGALREILLRDDAAVRRRALAELFYDPDGGTALADMYGELMAGKRDHYRLESYCTRRSGEIAWVNMTVAALRGPSAGGDAAIAMVEDITDKRQAQAALIHAERLAVAGKLAASLAHEINNPLQAIIGCVGLAEEATVAGESPAEYLALARTELRRVSDMVSRMRDLHRSPRAYRMRRTQVNDLLEQVLALSRRQCEERQVTVTQDLDPSTPLIAAATDQLRQVFLNLVVNALEAMPDGGALRVRSETTADPAGVRVTVADDGVGIPPENLPHIFKAFYSTKPGGTGIGLAITQDIVERHRGRIEVESQVGAGTEFSVWLPASAGP